MVAAIVVWCQHKLQYGIDNTMEDDHNIKHLPDNFKVSLLLRDELKQMKGRYIFSSKDTVYALNISYLWLSWQWTYD